MAEITLDKVSKRFSGGIEAVRNVSFTVKDGEFFILLGPSGCGKSTILNMIAGLESVTEGEIRVDGGIVNDTDPKDRNMAMVFQSYALYPHMSVRENMAFPLKLAKMDKQAIKRRVEQTAAMLELADFLDRMPRSLSGGQRQRVAMGRALVRQPRAFLLDEPLSNLDAKLRAQMRVEIARLQKKLGATMIYVTHDQTEAMTLGDRLALLRQGTMQQIGAPRELYTCPRNIFVAGFIGSPAMNFLPARRKGDRLLLPMMEMSLPKRTGDCSGIPEELIVGLRPEHIQPATGEAGEKPVFTAVVAMVEWLGAESCAHFDVEISDRAFSISLPRELDRRIAGNGKTTMVTRIDPSCRVAAGEKLTMEVDGEKMHLFDPASGECLGHAGDISKG